MSNIMKFEIIRMILDNSEQKKAGDNFKISDLIFNKNCFGFKPYKNNFYIRAPKYLSASNAAIQPVPAAVTA